MVSPEPVVVEVKTGKIYCVLDRYDPGYWAWEDGEPLPPGAETCPIIGCSVAVRGLRGLREVMDYVGASLIRYSPNDVVSLTDITVVRTPEGFRTGDRELWDPFKVLKTL